jgi:DNA-binding PadR family transcriptional regulator
MVERSFLVLLALHGGPRHGYAIKKAIAELTGGAVDLEPGGLYRLIGRLEDRGLVEPVDAPAGAESKGPPRSYFAITASGRRALADEGVRLERLVARPEFAAISRSSVP